MEDYQFHRGTHVEKATTVVEKAGFFSGNGHQSHNCETGSLVVAPMMEQHKPNHGPRAPRKGEILVHFFLFSTAFNTDGPRKQLNVRTTTRGEIPADGDGANKCSHLGPPTHLQIIYSPPPQQTQSTFTNTDKANSRSSPAHLQIYGNGR